MNKNIRKIFLLTLVILLLSNSFIFANELNLENQTSAYLVGDYNTGRIVEQYNIDEPIEIASITKLMSYLVVAEEIKNGNINLDESVTIDLDTARVSGSSMNLKEGEVITVAELLKGLMIVSGNDATYALAKLTYGTEEKFVDAMMAKADSLGLSSAEFHNSTGLPVPNPDGSYENRKQNKLSPKDIFNMSRYLIKEYPEVLELSSQTGLAMPERNFEKANTNDLLKTMPGVDGFKTGYTDKAGFCLVSTYLGDLENNNNRWISIVMGASSVNERSRISKLLLEYAIKNYKSISLLDPAKPVETYPISNVEGGYIKIYPKNSFADIVDINDNIDMKIKIDKKIKASLKKDEIVGNAEIYKNEEIVEEVELIIKEDIQKKSFINRIVNSIKGFFKKIFG